MREGPIVAVMVIGTNMSNALTIKSTLKFSLFFLNWGLIQGSVLFGDQTNYSAAQSGHALLSSRPGVRLSSLGNDQVAYSDSLEAMFSNPAGLSGLRAAELWINHRESLLDTRQESIAAAFPIKENRLGVSLQYLNYGSFEKTGESGGQPVLNQGSYRPYSALLRTAWATPIQSKIMLGIGLKAWTARINQTSQNGFAGDLGVFSPWFKNWDFGAAVRNLGPKVNDADLPQSIGVGTRAHLKPISLYLGFEEASRHQDAVHTGLEYKTHNYSLRGGYNKPLNESEARGNWGLGGGLRIKGWQVDYAWNEKGDLGDEHLISITIGLGMTPQEKEQAARALDQAMTKRMQERSVEHIKKGEAAVQETSWDQAVLEFSNALTWDPNSKKAKDGLLSAKINQEKSQTEQLIEEAKRNIAQNRWIDATLLLNQAAKLDPENTVIQNLLQQATEKTEQPSGPASQLFHSGVQFYVKGNFESAYKEWQKVLAIDPAWPSIHEYVAKARAKTLEEKLVDQKTTSQTTKSMIDRLSQNAYTYYTTGNLDEAIATWEKLLILDPNNADADVALREAKNKRDLLGTGASPQTNRKVMELSNNAFQLYAAGDLKGALRLWRQALAYDPRNMRIRNNIERTEAELSIERKEP